MISKPRFRRPATFLLILLFLNLLLWPVEAQAGFENETDQTRDVTTNSEQFVDGGNPFGLSEEFFDFSKRLSRRTDGDPTIVIGSDFSVTFTGSQNGANFLLKFPQHWNRKFVFFAHGYVAIGTPNGLSLPLLDGATTGILATALGQGYAYGYSAYGKIGYAVESGINSTHALKKLTDVLDAKRNYIVGESMGGNVTMGLLEKYYEEFDGALPYCGAVAGWDQIVRNIADFRVVYDYFTAPLGAPFRLPNAGNALMYDPNFSTAPILNSLGALFGGAAAGNPLLAGTIGQIAAVTHTNPDFVSFATTLFSSNGPTYLDLLQTAGAMGYGNNGKVYTGSANDAALNAGVERFTAVESATRYLTRWYTPRGDFKAKVLSIHNLIDPRVPYEFEAILKMRVAEQGNSSRLVQQVVDSKPITADPSTSGPAHCYFNASQFQYAWNELRNWVENGTPPTNGLNITTL